MGLLETKLHLSTVPRSPFYGTNEEYYSMSDSIWRVNAIIVWNFLHVTVTQLEEGRTEGVASSANLIFISELPASQLVLGTFAFPYQPLEAHSVHDVFRMPFKRRIRKHRRVDIASPVGQCMLDLTRLGSSTLTHMGIRWS